MPYYDLRCEDCKTESNIKATVQERVSGLLRCPACDSEHLTTIYRKVNVLKYHGKDCDVCPSASQPSAGGCCGGACAQTSWR